MARTVIPAITLALALAVSTLAQVSRPIETREPDLAKDLPDSMVKQAQATLPVRGPMAANTGGYQTPIVTVTVIAPSYVAHDKEIEYKLRVENTSTLDAWNVVVIHPLPAGQTIRKSDIPPSRQAANGYEWDLGKLSAGSRKEIGVIVMPAPDMKQWQHSVRVRFEHGRQATTQIARPELALKLQTPSTIAQGEVGFLRLEVRNGGLVEIRDVNVTLPLPDGLTAQVDPLRPGQPVEGGNSPQLRTWTLPRLGPGEVRYLDTRVTPTRGGELRVVANATTSNGLKANEASAVISARAPKLELSVSGPNRRGTHQTATYAISVRNAGPAPLRNVTVSNQLPPGCEVVVIEAGGRSFDREIQWTFAQLGPGEQRNLQLTTKATGPGTHQHTITASSPNLREQKTIATTFEPTAAIRMDVLADKETITIGDVVRLSITVENFGSAPASNVRAALIVPPSMIYVSADPAQHRADGGRIIFEPASIAANGKLVYSVTARATKAALPAIVAAEITADQLESGAVRREISVAIRGQ